MPVLRTLYRFSLKLSALGLIAGAVCAAVIYFHFVPKLPSVETLKDIQLQTPLRVYSADEKLIAEFGEKRRTPISYDQIPERFTQALLAAEDASFFDHFGIDIKGLSRAALQLAQSGRIQSGGSTITMQVAKNYFLTRERTFERKFNEILLALIIEQELSKEQILELYINKIYLGHRSYGIEAAAFTYYGKSIKELNIAQLAMIAGLPKAPSAFNPITNPTRALTRRNWILGRMHSLAFIDDQEYESALSEPVSARYHGSDIELYAPYIAEMVRSELFEQYGERIYEDGYNVFTTIDSTMQSSATQALRKGLLAYSYRHGYRGKESEIEGDLTSDSAAQLLKKTPLYANLQPALITAIDKKEATALLKNGESVTLPWDGIQWAKKYKSASYVGGKPKKAADVLKPGDLVRLEPVTITPDKKKPEETIQSWKLSQIPRVQGAFIALNPNNGGIKALSGGFSFNHNKFNRATQAVRQPGSNLKPFIYAAALEQGYSPATTINDAPVVFHDVSLEGNWRPENSSKKFYGPTRLREALYRSRNLVSIRILRAIGIDSAVEYLDKLGFDGDTLPRNLSLSLGAADLTPLQVATGYATLANGGYKISPFLIDQIRDHEGNTIFSARPETVCEECIYSPPEQPAAQVVDGQQITTHPIAPSVMDKRTAFLMTSILQDVITRGTGTRAKVLGRKDLAGKTGTTNDQKDAWFSGYNRSLVATAWVGFDQPKTLGRGEYGGRAALPIWIDFMRDALADKPESTLQRPDGIVQARIDPKTGLRAYPGQKDAIFELFRAENLPKQQASAPDGAGSGTTTEEIF